MTRSSFSRSFRPFVLPFLCAGFLALPGCSSTGSGSSDGTDGLNETDLDASRDSRFGEGGIPRAEGEGILRDVHFDYDSSVVTDSARQDIEYNLEVIKANPDVKLQLEGHCDERGTNDYNLALGAQRAKAVKEVLISLGVSSSRLGTISYGEEIPLQQGHDESAYAANRRVHFSAYRDLAKK